MKKEIKLCILVCIMCIATALNFVIALGCTFSTLDNLGITTVHHHSKWDLTDSLCFLIVSGYGIVITILYLKRKSY